MSSEREAWLFSVEKGVMNFPTVQHPPGHSGPLMRATT